MHFASMSLGIFDFLIEWLTKFLIWIIEFFIDLLMDVFCGLFYSIGAQLLNIVDFIQKMFKKLCGLNTFYMDGKAYTGEDPLLALMTDDTVMQVLLALTMVAFVMVIIAAIIKIIQSEFSTEGSKNSKGAIFGQALKSIMLFVLVPVCCIGGIILSNMLLKMVDMATSLSDGNATIGSSIMVSASAGANRVRMNKDAPSANDVKDDFGVTVPQITGNNREDVALAIDNIFRNNTNYNERGGGTTGWYYDTYIGADTDFVGKYYSIRDINFITLIGGALLAAYTMVMASFGMVMRLFKGAVLFMISPPMVALMPLDGGSAFKQWRTGFLKQVLAAYGTIASLNLLFIVLPAVNNIDLFTASELGAGGDSLAPILNGFAHVLFTLTGLFMLKDISSLISNMIGADDAAASGAGMAGKVIGTAAKIGSVAVGGAAGLAMKGAGGIASGIAKGAAKNGNAKTAKFFGAIGGALGNTGNKLGQKAKGTLGAAINKGTGMITGGALKTSFSEEMDYDKAKDAHDKKVKDRDERIANGEGSIGDLVGKGTGFLAKKTGQGLGAVAGVATGVVTGGVAAAGAGIGNIFRAVKHKPLTSAGHAFGNVWKGTTTGMITSFGEDDGGAKVRGSVIASAAQVTSGNTVVENMTTEAGKLKTSLDDSGGHSAFDNLQSALLRGDRGAANDQLDAMLSALQAIADKTEDQKDLMQKLTTLQQQVNSSSGTAASLDRIGKGMGTGTGSLATLMDKVHTRAEETYNVTSAVQIQGTGSDVKSQLEKMASDLKAALAAKGQNVDLDKLKREIIAAQQAELEKLKGDKK